MSAMTSVCLLPRRLTLALTSHQVMCHLISFPVILVRVEVAPVQMMSLISFTFLFSLFGIWCQRGRCSYLI